MLAVATFSVNLMIVKVAVATLSINVWTITVADATLSGYMLIQTAAV